MSTDLVSAKLSASTTLGHRITRFAGIEAGTGVWTEPICNIAGRFFVRQRNRKGFPLRIRVQFVLAMVIFVSCRAAVGQQSASEAIEPRIDRMQFAEFCTKLSLTRDQRTIAELAFSDYSQLLTDLARDLDQKAIAAGQPTVQDALRGKARIAPDELRRLRVAVLKCYEPAGPLADQAFNDLLMNVEIVLHPEQMTAFDRASRQLRREAYLQPRAAASDDQEYAGEGVDVIALVEAGLAEHGELRQAGRDAFAEILASYEQQLDALLQSTAAEFRAARYQRKIAQIEKNSAAMAEQEKTLLRLWKQMYDLNDTAAQQIARIVEESVGDNARQAWVDRIDRASFAWLYPRKKPDRQIEWIRAQSVSAEQREQAETVYEKYVGRRRVLSRKTIDLMLRARIEFETMIYSMMDPTGIDDRVRRGAYEELLKNTGEQSTLDTNAAAELEAALDPASREALRDAMKRPDRSREN